MIDLKIVSVAAYVYLLIGCGGVTEVVRNDNSWVGAVLDSEETLYYMEGCLNTGKCSDSKTASRIDRFLECGMTSLSSQYRNSFRVGRAVSFEIRKILDIGCYGTECSFSGGYAIAILKDSSGILSTRPVKLMDLENGSVC